MLDLDLHTVELQVSNRVASITLNRPSALNAWTAQLGRELAAVLDRVADDPEVRVIVFSGAGRAFSSGADLKNRAEADGTMDVQTALRDIYNPVILRVRTVPKPVIAAVNGPAVGIGCSLALACDLIVAAESAYFLMAFVNIGLTLDGGASHTLPARVGHARAFEIGYLGERIPAPQAMEWGLINRAVPDGELAGAVGDLSTKLASGPPGAYAAIKRSINARLYAEFADALELEAELQQERATSSDFGEGVMAFLEKRKPQFTGN
jgi:2-(1,2-epoxy-1,2-dihydrophenyl)acetyl-CoA isomerase